MRPIDLESIAVSNITHPPSSAAMAGGKSPGMESSISLPWAGDRRSREDRGRKAIKSGEKGNATRKDG